MDELERNGPVRVNQNEDDEGRNHRKKPDLLYVVDKSSPTEVNLQNTGYDI